MLLCNYLSESVNIYTFADELTSRKTRKFPLYKGRDNSRVLYISGVALQLAKSHNQTTMDIASGIVSHLSGIRGDVFRVQIVPPGSIYLELTDPFLAAWLQNLVVTYLEESGERETRKITGQNSSRLFAIQYAHARCYSLLLLAHREGLIKLTESIPDMSQNSASDHLVSAEQIPWLNDEQKLRLTHPAEGRLIAELVQVIDNLECPDVSGAVNWEKVALDLSQAFEAFWSQCRIWGKVKISAPELAQARLGLVIATQSVLRCLLVDKLGAVAPVEL
ncbi:DALR anticodon-binding domain-containing protein [Nodularia sphaerocarpa]|uniref:DALR anticodon-binding domain-containing protein n=1 Tax=Nodularia sphaerocarpa TaxID=137816 RepID=UPI001EFB063D|nr:DALR anticodon-binding domain-containing protein [Nodularia sphaerocarpa]MDB9374464.1 DALR anticodon-binding domain-containing protein [Nodularia sphaerocarpa CS-585]ULP72554.1 Arginine--tRNA ligase [Nodularia sphaerocarpa UHCC 0038]